MVSDIPTQGRRSPEREDRHPEMEPIRPAPTATLSRHADMYRATSHVSGHDAIEAADSILPEVGAQKGDGDKYREAGDEVYDRFRPGRKAVIVAVMSFCAFLSPVSSTSVLAATPEVAGAYDTTGTVINFSSAGYMAFMAFSPVVWGPMSQVFGRYPITLATAIAFFALSLGTALAPNLAAFFVFRALSAFEGTAFILLGAAVISDIYRPTERGTAVGWFMSGTLIGPAFGPFLGGIIVTYTTWRAIFWLQAALAGAGALAVFLLVPETAHRKKYEDLVGLSGKAKAMAISHMVNPWRVLRRLRFLNLALSTASSAALVWNMYSLLTPIRYVLNPRFHLETPLLSGLFYLAPGVGYLAGTFVGGRWADRTVKKWIRKRGGVRVPEDRLRAAVPFMGVLIPGCVLVYGWTVEAKVGGIPAPVVVLFLQGVGQLLCFPALNTYCLDAVPGLGAEIAAANFCVRYLAGCAGTAAVLPIINGVGVGWFSTISALLCVAGTAGSLWAIRRGNGWAEELIEKNRVEGAKNNDERDGAGSNAEAKQEA